MKNMKKVVIISSLLAVVFSIAYANTTFAAFDMMNLVNKQVNSTATGNTTEAISSIAGSIITIARVICSGVAVAMITLLGVKYMTAAPGEKADIKKHAIPYVVGAIIMFACTGILTIIENFASSI